MYKRQEVLKQIELALKNADRPTPATPKLEEILNLTQFQFPVVHYQEEQEKSVLEPPSEMDLSKVNDVLEDVKHTAPAVVGKEDSVQLIFQQGNSNKFWNASLNGNKLLIHYGRIGTNGQQLTKEFESDSKAKREMERLVSQKIGKGYS